MRPTRSVLAAIALVVAIAAAGCSNDEKQSSEAASTAAPSTAGPAGSSTSSTSATTAAPCDVPGASTADKRATGADTALLNAVAVARAGCAVAVTFTFEAPGSAGGVGYVAQYRPPPFVTEGEGRAVAIPGQAFISVILRPADVVDLGSGSFTRTYTGPDTITPTAGTPVTQVRTLGAFEGQSSWVIGLDAERPYAVATDATHVVVTIA